MKNRGTFFYILIAAALLAAAGLVFLLAPGRTPDTPPVLLSPVTPRTDMPEAEEQGVSPEERITVTPETVQTVISTLRRADCYSRTLTVTDYWSGGSRTRSIAVWARGEDLRLTVSAAGSAAVQHVLLKDGGKRIRYSDTNGVYSGPAAAGDADAYQSLMTYEKVLTLPPEDILDAGYTDFQGLNCIFVRFRSGSVDAVSECYVAPDTGLLMGERSYDGEVLVYNMDSSLPDLSTPDDGVFTLP